MRSLTDLSPDEFSQGSDILGCCVCAQIDSLFIHESANVVPQCRFESVAYVGI